jgi:hypothetical protein
VAELQNLQAANTASPFWPLPLEILEAFKQLGDGAQKDYIRGKYIELLELGMKERQWRETKAQAAKIEASAKPPADSLAGQYEEYSRLDPELGRRFFEANKEAIRLEVEERRLSRAAVAATL